MFAAELFVLANTLSMVPGGGILLSPALPAIDLGYAVHRAIINVNSLFNFNPLHGVN